jgi:hypothetical protein
LVVLIPVVYTPKWLWKLWFGTVGSLGGLALPVFGLCQMAEQDRTIQPQNQALTKEISDLGERRATWFKQFFCLF